MEEKVCGFKDCSKFGEKVLNVVCPRCKTVPLNADDVN